VRETIKAATISLRVVPDASQKYQIQPAQSVYGKAPEMNHPPNAPCYFIRLCAVAGDLAGPHLEAYDSIKVPYLQLVVCCRSRQRGRRGHEVLRPGGLQVLPRRVLSARDSRLDGKTITIDHNS